MNKRQEIFWKTFEYVLAVFIIVGMVLYYVARLDLINRYFGADPVYYEFPSSWSIHISEPFKNVTKKLVADLINEAHIQRDLLREASRPKTQRELIDEYIYEITSTFYPDIDPEVVRAIVYNESRYDPDSVNSKTGVVGLMQVDPYWHTKRAQSLGVSDLTDPYGNILVGCDILDELTKQTGSFTYALDFFAGGYPYANDYINSISPARAVINQTMTDMRNGVI